MYNIHVEFTVEYFEFNTNNRKKIRAKKIKYAERNSNINNIREHMEIETIDGDKLIIRYTDFISAKVTVRTEPE
jgi:hypothetical protein